MKCLYESAISDSDLNMGVVLVIVVVHGSGCFEWWCWICSGDEGNVDRKIIVVMIMIVADDVNNKWEWGDGGCLILVVMVIVVMLVKGSDADGSRSNRRWWWVFVTIVWIRSGVCSDNDGDGDDGVKEMKELFR